MSAIQRAKDDVSHAKEQVRLAKLPVQARKDRYRGKQPSREELGLLKSGERVVAQCEKRLQDRRERLRIVEAQQAEVEKLPAKAQITLVFYRKHE